MPEKLIEAEKLLSKWSLKKKFHHGTSELTEAILCVHFKVVTFVAILCAYKKIIKKYFQKKILLDGKKRPANNTMWSVEIINHIIVSKE